MYPPAPIKLHDCQNHEIGSGSELFIVEGDSASKSVARARDPANQAVLPMQGKPLNAMKASPSAVARNQLFAALVSALGTGWNDGFDLAAMRFDRVILLFDPDADGIHCSALMSMYFYRFMCPLLDENRVFVARAPLYEIVSPDCGDRLHAYNDDHYGKIREALNAKSIRYVSQRYRGLASINELTLVSSCIDPATRTLDRLTVDDAEAAIRIFCSGMIG